MIRLAQRKLFLAFDSMGYRVILMGSKDFLPPKFLVTSTVLSYSSSSQSRLFRSPSRGNVGFCASTRHFSPVNQNAYCCRNISIPVPRPIPGVDYDARHSQSQLAVQRQLTVLQEKLKIIGIDASGCLPGGTYPMICPFCKGGDSQEKCLTLYITNNGGAAEYTCFAIGCGKTGVTRVPAGEKSTYGSMGKLSIPKKETKVITEEGLELEPLSQEAMDWFDTRTISKETVQRNGIMEKRTGDTVTIAFVYRRNGEAVSCKYRDLTKKFWTEANTEKIFYGLDDIKEASDIIIVEGEMDKLALEEAGFRNCVSVPDGAPPKVSVKALPPEEEDTKYRYLWNCKDYITKASRIILATDGDPPGIALAEELARRLGRERCWRVKWPIMGDKSCKDANEVLSYKGPAALRQVIENAELYPIRGLFNFKDFFDEIDAYYYQSLGFELGVSTGWTALNQLYNIVPGELTIVTGVPNSGKSEWIDALLCNLNRTVGWKFALCSMENKVREHARKLLEKHMKKPFFDRYKGYERISVQELETGKKWLNDTFYQIRCENDCLPSVNWVLDLARIAVMRHGVHGLVIDPYNEIDHQRPPSQTETEYVSQMLTKIKRFAQHHACHVWFVAHPRQLHNWDGGPPNMYDISGSAHFINKCDNGIVIHRNRDPEAGPIDLVQVCVRKVRNKVIGTIGDAFLSYNKVTGVYSDVDLSTIKPINKNNGINNSQGRCPSNPSNAGYSSGR